VYSACCQAEPASHGVARSFGVDVRFVLAPVWVGCLPLVLYRRRLDLRVLARCGCLAVSTASANSHGLTLSFRVLQTQSRRPSLAVVFGDRLNVKRGTASETAYGHARGAKL
jgi:hypothetical protein